MSSIAQKIIFFGLVILIISSPAQDFKIISTDEQGLEVEFKLPTLQVTSLLGNDGLTYQRLQLPNFAKTEQVGFPELPITGTILQVPSQGDLQLIILQQVQNTLTIPHLYPVSQPILSKDGQVLQKFTKDATAYHSPTFYPNSLIILGKREILRGIPIVRIQVQPLQWQAQTKKLRYVTQLRFRLNFSQALPPLTEYPSHHPYDSLLRSIINGYRPRQIATPRANENQGPQRYTWQFKVNTSGIMQLSYETLLASGIPENCLSQGQFILHDRTEQIVPQVITQRSRGFGEGDRLEFYAQSVKDTFTNYNVYRLECWEFKSRTSPRGGLLVDGRVTGQAQAVNDFQETWHFEEDNGTWLETPGAPPKDYWFWKKISSPKASITPFFIPNLGTSASAKSLRVALQGESIAEAADKHQINVFLNDVLLGELEWEFLENIVGEFALPEHLLVEGENLLRLDFPTQAEGNSLYLNWLEVTCPRPLVAVQDELTFTVSGDGRRSMQVRSFSVPDIRIFDITDPAHFKEVINLAITPAAVGFQVTFEDEVIGTKTYYATVLLHQIEEVTWLSPSGLKQEGADYLIITTKELLPAVQPLLKHRERQGLRSTAVSVEDIYNEFGFGLPTPYAIKEFLKYAYTNWPAPAPSYVLFFGDATVDYKNLLASKIKTNQVPPYLIATLFGVTPDDNWLVSVDGDDPLPDMMVGRLPGGNVAEVSMIVNKIIGYETASQIPQSVLLVADRGTSFEELNDQMDELYLAKMTVKKVYLSDYGKEVEKAKEDIVKYINAGQLITQYIGHGHIDIWGSQRILNPERVALLKNQNKLTWVLALNCLNAYFAAPGKYSLGEELVRAPKKGAVAVFSSAGLSYSWHYEVLTHAIFSDVFKNGQTQIGKIITKAKLATYQTGADEEVLSTFTLIGDPASLLQINSLNLD